MKVYAYRLIGARLTDWQEIQILMESIPGNVCRDCSLRYIPKTWSLKNRRLTCRGGREGYTQNNDQDQLYQIQLTYLWDYDRYRRNSKANTNLIFLTMTTTVNDCDRQRPTTGNSDNATETGRNISGTMTDSVKVSSTNSWFWPLLIRHDVSLFTCMGIVMEHFWTVMHCRVRIGSGHADEEQGQYSTVRRLHFNGWKLNGSLGVSSHYTPVVISSVVVGRRGRGEPPR